MSYRGTTKMRFLSGLIGSIGFIVGLSVTGSIVYSSTITDLPWSADGVSLWILVLAITLMVVSAVGWMAPSDAPGEKTRAPLPRDTRWLNL